MGPFLAQPMNVKPKPGTENCEERLRDESFTLGGLGEREASPIKTAHRGAAVVLSVPVLVSKAGHSPNHSVVAALTDPSKRAQASSRRPDIPASYV